MNKIVKTAVLFLTLSQAFCINELTDSDDTVTPVFADRKTITLNGPADGATMASNSQQFTYTLPAEVKHAVLLITTVPVAADASHLTVDKANYRGGIHSGLGGFEKGFTLKSSLYSYDTANDSFMMTPQTGIITTLSGNYFWAMWGYDKHGNLTHSSESRKVAF